MRALSVIFFPFLAPSSYVILPLFSPASASLFFSSKQNLTNITSSYPLHPDRHHHLLLTFMFQTPSSTSSLLVYFLPSSVKPASRHHHHQSLFCLVSLPCVAVSHRCCLSSTISFIFVQLVRSPSATSSLFPLQSTDQHLSGKPAAPSLRHLASCCPVDWSCFHHHRQHQGGGDSSCQGRLLPLCFSSSRSPSASTPFLLFFSC